MKPKAEIRALEAEINQLKVVYEQYFLGMEPREPLQLRQTVERKVHQLSTGGLHNTADRFKFNSVRQRFQTFRRQWDETLRKMEAGTYKRHLFKANLRDSERAELRAAGKAAAAELAGERRSRPRGDSVYEQYMKAARECGQKTSGLTPEKLQALMAKQAAAIRAKHDVSKINFRVSVEDGKVKLKASAKR